MKKVVLIVVLLLTAIVVPQPHTAGATGLSYGAKSAETNIVTLAPSQRDINIAVLAVVLGGVLVGYEKASREHHLISIKKRRGRVRK